MDTAASTSSCRVLIETDAATFLAVKVNGRWMVGDQPFDSFLAVHREMVAFFKQYVPSDVRSK